MKKALKIFFLVIFVLLVLAVVGVIIFIKTFDIDRYRSVIIEQAEKALNRPVDFKDMELKVTLKDGVRLELAGLTIGEEGMPEGSEFVAVESLSVGIDLMAAARREIIVTDVEINSPRITVVQRRPMIPGPSASAPTVPAPSTSAETASVPAQPPPAPPVPPAPSSAGPAEIPDVSIKRLKINNGHLIYRDETVEPARTVEVKAIDLSLKDFNLKDDFSFALQAAVLHPEPNISLAGTLALDVPRQQVTVSRTRLTMDLGNVDWPQFFQLVPVPAGTPLPQELDGNLTVDVRQLTAGAAGLGDFSVDVRLDGGTVDFPKLAEGVALRLDAVHLDAREVALGRPFSFSFKAAYLNTAGAQPNIALDGTAAVTLPGEVRLTDLRFKTDLGSFALERLKSSVAVIPGPLPDSVAGELDVLVKDLSAGAKGVEQLKADLSLLNGAVVFKEIAPGIPFAISSVNLKAQDAALNQPFHVSFQGAYLNEAPNLFFNGDVAVNSDNQSVLLENASFKTDLSTFSLEHLKNMMAANEQIPVPDELEGKMDVQIARLSAGRQGLTSMSADVVLQRGRVHFAKLPQLSGPVSLNALSLTAKGLSLENPFQVAVSAGLLSETPNVSFDGTLQLDMPARAAMLSQAVLSADLARLPLADLGALAGVDPQSLPQAVEGQLKITVDQIKAGASGVAFASAQGQLDKGMVKWNDQFAALSAITARFTATGQDASLDSFSAQCADGTISGTAKVQDFAASQRYSLQMKMERIDVSQLLNQKDWPYNVEGFFAGNISAVGQGFDPQKSLNNLTGEGRVALNEGRIKGLNILKEVVDKISIVPNLGDKVRNSLPPESAAKMENKDTVLNTVAATLSIKEGAVHFDPVDFDADGFVFQGRGRAAFDQTYAVEGPFTMSPDLSTAMVNSVPDLDVLLNDAGVISIPAWASGKGAEVRFGVDLKDLGKNVIKRKAGEELKKVLDKALERETPQTPQQPPQGGGPQPPAQKSPEEEVIDGLFDVIFGE